MYTKVNAFKKGYFIMKKKILMSMFLSLTLMLAACGNTAKKNDADNSVENTEIVTEIESTEVEDTEHDTVMDTEIVDSSEIETEATEETEAAELSTQTADKTANSKSDAGKSETEPVKKSL